MTNDELRRERQKQRAGLTVKKPGPKTINKEKQKQHAQRVAKDSTAALSSGVDPDTASDIREPSWTEVVTRIKKKKNSGFNKRNPAIMVDSTPEDLPALAKKISKKVDQQAIGNNIVGMRQARRNCALR